MQQTRASNTDLLGDATRPSIVLRLAVRVTSRGATRHSLFCCVIWWSMPEPFPRHEYYNDGGQEQEKVLCFRNLACRYEHAYYNDCECR